ncbi:MAG: MBL fold metallo-hydrolase [Smithellaceae bacterium]|nr:MBL fold metallo-hydrolase [Smithellaceae bacterium]
MYTAFLINQPSSDPGVYLELKYRRDAFLFDLGDMQHLPPRQIRKIRYIFVSHTHMDHFIGFDHLLRICLGRDQHISLFGPPGFLANVEGKLGAYTWNLVRNYTNDFALTVTEVHETCRVTRAYRCRSGFVPENEETRATGPGTLVEGEAYVVRAVFLDHSIPCLAFCFEEKTRLNVKKNVLEEMGLPTGAWLTRLKEQILNRDPEETPVRIFWKNEAGETQETFAPLGLLRDRAVKMTSGQKVCYITDAVWSEQNAARMIELARGAELLFVEAPFLHEDEATAARKHHLTARQAGRLAALANVKRLCLFHFSPKYKGREDLLQNEAQSAFSSRKPAGPPAGDSDQ